MRTFILLTLTVVGLAVPSAADASATTCQGRRATIVGTPGKVVTGTPRADVVLSNGADEVVTGGGDDLVCVSGHVPHVFVTTGAGDDTVLVLRGGSADRAQVNLGSGSDTYRGGSGKDAVIAEDGDDLVVTKGGRDRVRVASTAARPSTVRSGGDPDRIQVDGTCCSARVHGGLDQDELRVQGTFKGRLHVDNYKGRASVRGRTLVSWSGIEQFDLDRVDTDGIDFRGTDADERVSAKRDGGTSRHRFDTGGGNDHVTVDSRSRGTFDAGPGHDVFEVHADWTRRLRDYAGDLTTGMVTSSYVDITYTWEVSDVADLLISSVYLSYADVTMRGDGGPNRLVADGCHVAVDAGGGDDVVEGRTICNGAPTETTSVLSGGDGDDELSGYLSDDLLDGGPGTDTADGREGSDTCYAETTVNCELP